MLQFGIGVRLLIGICKPIVYRKISLKNVSEGHSPVVILKH